MSKLTQARLKEVLKYDKRTGVFTWKVRTSNRVRVGDVAGRSSDAGYRIIGVDGVLYLAHRLAWLYVKGEWPPVQIDHEDRNPRNNTWKNLRLATNKQNNENQGIRSDNTSGVRGVCWNKYRAKWQASIRHNKRMIYLGLFGSTESATAARKAAEKRYFTHAPA